MTSDNKCREMFEAEHHHCCDLTPFGDWYLIPAVSDKWRAWQAAYECGWTARGEADAEANPNELLVKLKPGRLSPSSCEFRGDE